MNENIISGLLFAGGALAYNIWGFLQAAKAAKASKEVEKFDFAKSAITVLPSLILGFLAGYNLSANSTSDYVAMVTSGFGVAAAQGQLGINSFFDKPE